MIAGTFSLLDQDGAPVTQAAYRGLYLLVFFGFTHCRVVCPRALARLTRVLAALGPDAELFQPLYISVDPARDTPERMRLFLTDYHPRIRGLTGSTDDIDAAKRSFRVFAERRADPAEPDGYSVPHTAITYLLDRDGAYRAHFTDATPDETLLQALRDVVSRDGRSMNSSA